MRSAFLFMFLLLVSFTELFSDSLFTVRVMDRDINIPLEGVRVRALDDVFYTSGSGSVSFNIDSGIERFVLIAELIGYTPRQVLIHTRESSEAVVYLSMDSFIEGEELVILGEVVGVSDEEIGVSTVIGSSSLKTASESGIVEDVVSSVKRLPGVSYSGSFNTSISVRGGEPSEFGISLDGFILRYPYHWAGVFSILNPSVISSIKFSSGIFSSRTGMATSGFLEAATLTPRDIFKFKGGIATTSADFIISAPIVKDKSGFFLGFRASFIDFPAEIYKLLQNSGIVEKSPFNLKKAPYFEDLFFKIYIKPADRVEWYFNAFFGNDGLATANEIIHNNIKSSLNLQYLAFNTFAFTGVKILPNDRVFLNIMGGYEFLYRDNKQNSVEKGVTDYSEQFRLFYNEKYGEDLAGNNYSIDGLKGSRTLNIMSHNVQGKIEADFTLNDFILMSVGTGVLYEYNISELSGEYYAVSEENGKYVYRKTGYDIDADPYNLLNPFMFMNFNFNVFRNIIKIETGFRVDYFNFSTDNMTLSSYPFVSPRFNLTAGLLRDKAIFRHIGISFGGGLFAKEPFSKVSISRDADLSLFDIQHTKNASAVVGIEAMFLYGFRLRMEGYYKYYFDRTYKNGVVNADNRIVYHYNSDGLGHSAGFDVLFDRRISSFIDGQIAYSFSYVKYFNPSRNGLGVNENADNSQNISDSRRMGEPVGIWYFPAHHRFHNFNISLNIKPASWMTISPSFTFASGSPKIKYGDKKMIDVVLPDGSTAEMYTRSEEYSDSERGDFFIPFNLKVSFQNSIPRTKAFFEFYIAVEDLFAFLYKPVTNVTTNKYSGDTMVIAESTFSIPIPIPAIGLKISF